MRYPVAAPGFALHPVELETGGLWRGARLLQDGVPVPRGRARGTFAPRRDDGGEGTARLVASPFVIDPVPRVEIDGRRLDVVRPLRWYELVWVALPILLVFLGGALGALVGGVAAAVNARILRTDQPLGARYLLSAGVTLFAVAVYGVLAIIILGLVGR